MPTVDLSEDSGACVTSKKLTPAQLLFERVITKLFNHYEIPLQITDSIRAAVRSKLWRMGKRLLKCGGDKRQQQLTEWKEGNEATWNFEVCGNEVARQVLKRKQDNGRQLDEERVKRKKLEGVVRRLQHTTKEQSMTIARIKTGCLENSRGSSSKSWTAYSRQQQHNK